MAFSSAFRCQLGWGLTTLGREKAHSPSALCGAGPGGWGMWDKRNGGKNLFSSFFVENSHVFSSSKQLVLRARKTLRIWEKSPHKSSDGRFPFQPPPQRPTLPSPCRSRLAPRQPSLLINPGAAHCNPGYANRIRPGLG